MSLRPHSSQLPPLSLPLLPPLQIVQLCRNVFRLHILTIPAVGREGLLQEANALSPTSKVCLLEQVYDFRVQNALSNAQLGLKVAQVLHLFLSK